MPRQSRRRWKAQAVRPEIQEVTPLPARELGRGQRGSSSRAVGFQRTGSARSNTFTGAPSLCGAGSITCFWNINGILIHINVAVQRSAEMAASWGHEWFFGEVIRKGQSRNAAEMAV